MNNTFEKFQELRNSVVAQEYKRFMFDPANSLNCEACPENHTGKYRGCGQQNCWVDIHCN